MQEKIKCPWCGNVMEASGGKHLYTHEYRTTYACPSCGARGPLVKSETEMEALVEAWYATMYTVDKKAENPMPRGRRVGVEVRKFQELTPGAGDRIGAVKMDLCNRCYRRVKSEWNYCATCGAKLDAAEGDEDKPSEEKS